MSKNRNTRQVKSTSDSVRENNIQILLREFPPPANIGTQKARGYLGQISSTDLAQMLQDLRDALETSEWVWGKIAQRYGKQLPQDEVLSAEKALQAFFGQR